MAMYSRQFVQCAVKCKKLKHNELYKVETFSKTHVSIWIIDEDGKEIINDFPYEYFYDAELYKPHLLDNSFKSKEKQTIKMFLYGTLAMLLLSTLMIVGILK